MEFSRPVEETALFCGMNWQVPFILHGAHEIDEAGLAAASRQLRERLEGWLAAHAGAADNADGRP